MEIYFRFIKKILISPIGINLILQYCEINQSFVLQSQSLYVCTKFSRGVRLEKPCKPKIQEQSKVVPSSLVSKNLK